jgi:glycosyltransferase involved in cell wall biosynthesis
MSTLNVLLVAYLFPPGGGVGVLRAASLARYFPAEGIQLDVLTARNASAVGADPGLLNEIPAEVRIHRTVTIDLPFGLKKRIKGLITGAKKNSDKSAGPAVSGKPNLLKRILENLLLPDPQVTWYPVLIRAARRIIRERKIDVVLITVPPFSSVLLVEKLRKEFPHLAIVVDFRDEWLSTAIDLVGFSRGERARRIARNVEASAVTNASIVVAVTEAARREIRDRYPQEPESKFVLLPNGFDATKLPPSAPAPGPRPDGTIVVTHIGTVYASTEPTALVEALQSLPSEVKSRFKFRYIGHVEEPRFREKLLQLGEMVELKGFVPQREALAAMNDSDYVLLTQHGRLNIAAKLYDYIGGRKPVLATVHPNGPERVLIEELRAGWWVSSRDVEGIRRLFIDAAQRVSSLQREFQPDLAGIAKYERKVLAQTYAALLHAVASTGREPGSSTPLAEPAGERR